MTQNRRHAMRFEKAFPVLLSSDFGYLSGVCRNFSTGGMAVEMAEPLPIGTRVTVHFPLQGAAGYAAHAEVKHAYYFNYGDETGQTACRGIGLRFVHIAEPTNYDAEWFAGSGVMH